MVDLDIRTLNYNIMMASIRTNANYTLSTMYLPFNKNSSKQTVSKYLFTLNYDSSSSSGRSILEEHNYNINFG